MAENTDIAPLEAQNLLLRTVLDEVEAYVFAKDLQGRYIFANKQVCDLFGYPREDILGSTDDKFFNLSISEELRINDRRVLDQGERIESEETNVVARTGETRVYWTVKTPLRDATGAIAGMCGVSTDITERMQAEDELLRNKNRYHGILHNMMDAYWRVDANGRIVEANLAIAKMHGYSLDEILQMSVSDFEVIESIEETKKRIETVKREGHDLFESRHRCKDGRTIDLEISLNISIDDPGHIDAFHRDVTERKRAEELLQASNSQLHCVLGATADGILAIDNNGKVIQANQRFAKMWQIPQALLDSKDDQALLDFVVNQLLDPEAFLKKVRSLYGTEAESEDTLHFKDGRVYERYSSPLRINNTVAGRVWSFRDVTERAHAEEMLRAKEEQFRGLVEQEIAGIYIIQDGKFAYVNQRFAEIRGYGSADELIGRDTLQLVADDDRDAVVEQNRQLLAGGKRDTDFTFTALRKDGSSVDVGAHSTLASHCGRPAIIGLMQDISEKKRAEEQIQRYIQQLKTAFMSTVEVATVLSELRDPYTSGHERRVAEIAVALGGELGLDAQRLEGLRVTGYLHDIGKINIPAEILSKPGKLSAIEYQLIQGHAQSSYDVLKTVEWPWPVAEVALQHHERMDGSGYPKGLKGDAILLEARILAVADVLEAMSSHRPYRPGLGIATALDEIERGRGTAYDTEVASACLRLFRDKNYVLPV